MQNKRVLIVEDSASMAELYKEYLAAAGYQAQIAGTGADALAAIAQSLPDAIMLDINLPDMSGMDILRQLHEQKLPVVSLIVTGHGSVDMAVEAMALGAYDFIEKPFSSKRLLTTLGNALERQTLTEELETYKEEFNRDGYEGFIGASLPMQSVYRIIDSAAPSNATVFITGESGTGKEVCASAIHQRSERAQKPFIAINCGAIPRDLMESEIFGHTKGAFTGAVSSREGAASQADGGTLFLDELCEMDLDLQTKLLRFIQTGSFQKVGSNKTERVDVRFICATNKDPLAEVKAGNFREDLYYRLHVIPIHLPPLRERGGDVSLILNQLLQQYAQEEQKQFSGFDNEAQASLLNYEWPGNVRQLQNVIRNIVVLNTGGVISPDMLPPPLNDVPIPEMVPNPALMNTTSGSTGAMPASGISSESSSLTHQPQMSFQQTAIRPLWLVEKEVIEAAIDQCDGNIPKAAALLEVSASTIYRKRERWANGKN
ncbi:sigma-54 dependent transcriptional regulator [Bacterioplanoides sp. SCSIO 12839]|uniref:sigma-54-dependent transcriptional regulator n=1 Tax=Bacterioplanoides sp. SCSIO 12839 TaxID=2829569 RepID=UPI0021065537|nr:sigma-54 dependent transcriptional regulator [Bacterioplanoides sp. SCSIO 12839]